MTPSEVRRLDRELSTFIEGLTCNMGRPERRASMGLYITGLLLDGERKSMQPMAGRLVDDPRHVEAMRQRLQECVVISGWSDEEMLRRLSLKLDRELPGIEALVVDDTGIPKKGKFSVGVARQYSGTLGRVDNCQVGVSLHLAGESGSGCIAFDLFLPDEWTGDPERLESAGVPHTIQARTKIQIALAQIDRALADGVRRHVVLADAGYGDSTDFREGLSSRGLLYIVGVNGQPVVWPPESNPHIPARQPGIKGHPRTRYRDDEHPPESIADLGRRLQFRKVTWREGSRGKQSSRFAAVRIRTAHHHVRSAPPGAEQWLLVEWPEGEDAPTKHWLSNLPATMSVTALVRLAKMRWRVERDYQDLKTELGLDHFEGRTWRGFHHHATLCAVAHAFLALQRALFPPEEDEVDTSGGSPAPPAGCPSADRMVSAMSPTG